jgi:virulence factor Mce-like protein
VKRVFIATLVVVGVAALAGFLADGFPKPSTKAKAQYWVEVDNAFGLIQGGDLKIAGVRAGTITDLKLDKRSLRAKVGFRITEQGFGSLRTDTSCESRPQSLIGEYFLDCDPGTAKRALKKGATIPVERTASTVPPDLVNDIMRRPQAERLSIILSSLGTAVAGNAERLNEAVRRGAPALRETDRVLAILAQQNKVIRDLNANADTVVGDLAEHKADVSRWVIEARNLSADSAERASDISAGWRKLPGFLAQLRPAMAALGRTADTQGPALETLGQNATQLKRFFDELGPFSEASRPALRALGQAGRVGSSAAKPATATVNQLNTFAKGAPELGQNLAIILEHLDDRGNTVEYDKRAAQQQGVPEPSGYSGLEGLLQYVLDQATSTNIYDQSTHILAVQADEGGECRTYKDADSVRGNEPEKVALRKQCQAKTGPNAPGVDTIDISADDAPPRQVTYEEPVGAPSSRNEPRSVPPAKRDENVQRQVEEPKHEDSKPQDAKPEVHKPEVKPPPIEIPKPDSILPGNPPSTPQVPPPPKVPDTGKVLPGTGTREDNRDQLLDYLLGS